MGATDTSLVERLLSATQVRSKVIAANIANANTPGYVRREVNFEELLRAAQSGSTQDLEDAQPKVVEDRLSPANPDGNNVSLELELNAFRENRLMYETYAAILQGHFELMRAAISEGR